MFLVLIALAAATPPEPTVPPDAEEAEATTPVFDAWAGLPPADADDDDDDEDDDDVPPPTHGQAAPPQEALSLVRGLGVVAAAGLMPVLFGGVGVGATYAALVIFNPPLGWGVLLLFPAVAIPAMAIGVPVGAEVGVALFGDARDHVWVSLGAVTGGVCGGLLFVGASRAGPIQVQDGDRTFLVQMAPEHTLALGVAAVTLGSAAGTGTVLLAREWRALPALPMGAWVPMVGAGSIAVGVGGLMSVVGPITNDSLLGVEDVVGPALLGGGVLLLAASTLFSPREGPIRPSDDDDDPMAPPGG